MTENNKFSSVLKLSLITQLPTLLHCVMATVPGWIQESRSDNGGHWWLQL